MNTNRNFQDEIEQDYEDSALGLLMDDYSEEMGDKLWAEFEDAKQHNRAPVIPELLDQKCQKIIKTKLQLNKRLLLSHKIHRGLRRIALFAIVLFSVSSILLLSVDAIRIPLLNYFIEYNARSTTTANNVDAVADSDKLVTLEHLVPAGYSVSDYYIGDSQGQEFYSFADESGYEIIIAKDPITSTYDIDTENATQYYSTIINGYDAVFVEKAGFRVIVYNTDDNIIFNIYANGLPLEEFQKLVYRLVA